MQNTPFTVWQNISGSGMLTALYVFSVIYLFVTEKENYKRILLIYFPAFWLFVLMLPVTYRIIAEVIDEELYYRFFWLLPMTLTIAYTCVQLYNKFSGIRQKLVGVGLILCIMISGDFLYNNWRYSKVENIYHIPQSVVELCDLMHVDGREVMAVFPAELLQYVRQYDSTICMPYGRNVLVEDWSINHPLYDLMEGSSISAEELAVASKSSGCVYIVLHQDKVLTGSLEDYGYRLKTACQEYNVYYYDENLIFMNSAQNRTA